MLSKAGMFRHFIRFCSSKYSTSFALQNPANTGFVESFLSTESLRQQVSRRIFFRSGRKNGERMKASLRVSTKTNHRPSRSIIAERIFPSCADSFSYLFGPHKDVNSIDDMI